MNLELFHRNSSKRYYNRDDEVRMVSILLVLGAALVLGGYWANAVQGEQRQAIRVDVERERGRGGRRH